MSGSATVPPPADLADTGILATFRHHSRTFSLATRLLPADVRMPVAVVYVFCRTVDDVADVRAQIVGTPAALAELESLARALEDTIVDRPPDGPLWPRLARTMRAWSLRPEPFRELLDGARWDLRARPIEDLGDLLAYSELVAGSVAEMVLPLLVRPAPVDPSLVAPARSLGVAMQITNVLRDVGEDLRLGRCYLPTRMLVESGLAPGNEPDPTDPAYRRLLERLMSEAEGRYTDGLESVRRLPARMRVGIRTAARLYREILNEIRANAYDNLSRRAIVPAGRKVARLVSDGYDRRREALRLRMDMVDAP